MLVMYSYTVRTRFHASLANSINALSTGPLPLVFSDSLTCKQVLNIMVILGFMLNYMLRVNMTIAIVSMVMPSNDTSSHSDSNDRPGTSECFDRRITANVTSFDDGGSTSTVAPDSATSSLYQVRATHVRYSLRYLSLLVSSCLFSQNSRSRFWFSGRNQSDEIPVERVPD